MFKFACMMCHCDSQSNDGVVWEPFHFQAMFVEPKPFSCLTKAFAATPSIHCCVGHLCHFFPATGDAQREDRRLGSLVLLVQIFCFISTCQHCRSHTFLPVSDESSSAVRMSKSHSVSDGTNRSLRWPEIGMYLDHEQMRRGGRRMVSIILDWKVVGLLLLFYLPRKIEKPTVTVGCRVAG